jgi:hypothetical protein
VRGAVQDRPERGPGEKKRAGAEEEQPNDERPRTAEQAAEDGVEHVADHPSALLSEQDHRPDPDEEEPRAKRADVDDRGSADQEDTEREKDQWHADPRRADERVERGVHLRAD